MILLSLHCNACSSTWVEAHSAVGRWTSFPCIYCGSAAVDACDHDHVRAEAA